MTGWARSIAAITLVVEDLPAARTFYEDVFEVSVVFADEVSAVFPFGETVVNLLDSSAAPDLFAPAVVGGPGSGQRMQLTVPVEDVDARCRELVARGVTLLNGPVDRPWGIRTASFQDPAGHVWELTHDL
jgi:lactoylglutathione lyase